MSGKHCRKGKVPFPTPGAALAVLRRIYDSGEPRLYTPTGVEPSRCRSCGSWHLTSKPGKRWRSGKTQRR